MTKVDIDILKILLNHDKVSIDQLSSFLGTSPVNIRKSIVRLNQFLIEHKLGELTNSKTVYSLNLKTTNFKSSYRIPLENLSPNERYHHILWELIFEKKINLTTLADTLHLNRTSLNLDLKRIKKILLQNNIDIKSLAWRGIQVSGKPIDIHYFACKFLFKFLIEKEYNKLSWELYGCYLNPKIKNSIDSYMNEFKASFYPPVNFTLKIIEKLNRVAGVESYTYIKATLLYLFIFEKNINSEDFKDEDILALPEILQKRYYQLLKSLSEIDEIKNAPQFYNNIKILTFLLLHIDEMFFEVIDDQKVLGLKKHFEDKYNIKINHSDTVLLNILYKRAIQKNIFKVVSYNNYYLGENSLPQRLIDDLTFIFDKFEIEILKEDYLGFALYLYQLICEKYEKDSYNDKILIIDSSTHNWIGLGFKNEILKYIPSITIDVKSICKLSSIRPEKYDYILFTNFTDEQHIIEFFPDFKDKIHSISYHNYFEVNNFLEDLYFCKSRE